MAFVLLDDQWYNHPKWRSAPGDSIALWAAALAWCNDHDDTHEGRIPTHTLHGLLGGVRNVKRTIADLVDRHALVRDGDCHLIHDYRDRQRLSARAAKAEELSAKRSAAGKKGAESRWQTDGKPMANDVATGWPDDRRPTTHVLESQNDDDSENTPASESSSSWDDEVQWRWQIALLVSERSKSRTGGVRSYATGVLTRLANERGRDLGAWRLEGLTPEQVADLVEPVDRPAHPSMQAPTRSRDPECTECDPSDGLRQDDEGRWDICSCWREEPATLATVTPLRREA